MSTVWMTSDWHLGHKNILKYRHDEDQFKTRQELESLLVRNFKEKVGKRDVTYFLGDMCFDHESLSIIKDLPGTKLLLLGNHDNHLGARDFLEAFDDIIGPIKYKGFWLTHQPIHPQELYGKKNIHGHTHNQDVMYFNTITEELKKDVQYVNVCVDQTDFAPVRFEDIRENRYV